MLIFVTILSICALICNILLFNYIKKVKNEIIEFTNRYEAVKNELIKNNSKTVSETLAELNRFSVKINKFESVLETFNNGFKPLESTYY